MAMFTLMRKNEEVMMLQIGQDGNITKLGKRENIALLPLQNRTSPKGGILEMYKRKIDMYEKFAAGVNLSTLSF
ncbi:hypothetical protein [Butyrivibrio sp. FCS014]|uniref:hypothetical protein n=1 Tax=Butyrivibrio sp. FCS014 TaxID=1408304 RepID=UPI0004B96967|nr:hypothetical protein [Butyrivibrio sp. FCS014]